MQTKYYSLGDMSEADGVTPMKILLDDDGNQLIGFQNGPESWYKPKELTKEEFEQMFAPGAAKRGAIGVVDDEGLKKWEAQRATFNEYHEKKMAHEVKKVKRLLAKGIIEKDEVAQELINKGFRDGSAIEAEIIKEFEAAQKSG